MRDVTLFCAVLLVALTILPSQGRADMSYTNFSNITHGGNPYVGDQFTMEVSGSGAQATFTFTNDGPVPSSITRIYFDDAGLFGIASITNGPGVSFDDPATPGHLPGGTDASPSFDSADGFSMGAVSGPPGRVANGVNNTGGEWVSVTFDLMAGSTFDDVIAALGDGSVRVGLHVQAIGGGPAEASDSYVSIVALPQAVLLGLLGLAAAGLKLRRLVEG